MRKIHENKCIKRKLALSGKWNFSVVEAEWDQYRAGEKNKE